MPPKNNNHSERAEVGGRLIQVLLFITANPSTREDISDETGVSLRTVGRDLNALQRAGVKIEETWRRLGKASAPTRYVSVTREWWEEKFKKRRERYT